MVSEKVVVRNKTGLHMRPAAELSQICSKLKSDVLIISGEKRINPKSILMLMGCGITAGTEITVQCDGPTEVDDLQQVVAAINSGFGEEMIEL